MDHPTLVAECIRSSGTPHFGEALDALLQPVAAFDMSCGFAFSDEFRPVLLYDGYSARTSRDALQKYLSGGYLLDPFYVASVGSTPDGVWRMAELAPEDFFSSAFASSPTVHPCISDDSGSLVEEVGYVVRVTSSWRVTWSLMRTHGQSRFSSDELTALRDIEPVVAALAVQHCSRLPLGASDQDPVELDPVDAVLRRAFGDVLTASQYRVVTLILRGHSNSSAAQTLHLAESTVKLHRHNAYVRLDISSQAELFQLFLRALEKGEAASAPSESLEP